MLPRPHPALIALIHDIVMSAVAFVAAVVLRMGWDAFEQVPQVLVLGTGLFCAIAALVFSWTGLYRGVWRYASLDDIIAIVKAVSLAVLLFVACLFLITRLDALPRSTPIIVWFALIGLLAVPRFVYRVLKDGHFNLLLRRTAEARKVPVLLVGSGDEADVFIREMARSATGSYRPIGIVDDKARRIGRSIRGVPVLGEIEDIPELVRQLARNHVAPQRLILTKDRIDADQVRRLLEISEALALPLARLPQLTDFRRGGAERLDVRPIAIEDLLGRPQTPLDRPAMAALVGGRRVLVTGAGGTIGGELARQVAALGPASLTLLDSAEFALYAIDLELGEQFPDLPRRAVLGDVRDRPQLAALLGELKPELVFHAAALKHVPMSEANPEEAILTNAIGTRNMSELCRDAGVSAMVMISTDKAVNPTSVMGATKRLAEAWCQTLDLAERRRQNTGSGTRFITVRFGNVLGSTGSVVPLFQRQLARGGPLTVTHPDITRYFMTVREAVELVLQATTLGMADADAGGQIYVLDMGEPVRIVELARQMIRLAGLRPDRDIAIAFTGLRPGEKLHEELFHAAEALVETAASGIRLAHPRTVDGAVLARVLDELEAAARARRSADALALLAHLVPEFSGAPIPLTEPGVQNAR
ncbi:MAG: nucleoside-diphosphate sugar epimerase/dehydratase [Pseudomonadota bacterium]